MASLIDCPKELQDSILELLLPHNLSSFSLVNKRCREIAEPLLYSSIKMEWWQDKIPPFVPLLRTIIDRPELAGHIRRLHLDGESFGTGLYWNSHSPPVPTMDLQMNEASNLIKRTKVAHAGLWIHELHAGTMDSLLSLLISLLPDLRSLYLRGSFTIATRLLGMMLRAALCEPSSHQLPRYQNLSAVTFFRQLPGYCPKSATNTADVLPFFYLPRIQRLFAEVDNTDKFEWPAKDPPSPPLESLVLYGMREAPLERLCSVLKSVQKIKWEYCGEPVLGRGKEVTQLDKIAEAMHHVRHTLKDLTITATWFPGPPEGDPENSPSAVQLPPHEDSRYPLAVEGSLDGLASLHNLRRLQVPWIFLVGILPLPSLRRLSDGIPGNVETLVLTNDFASAWDNDSIVTAIEEELEYRRRELNKLRCISLLLWHPEEQLSSGERTRLESMAAQAGIDLMWAV